MTPTLPSRVYTDTLELDLSTVEPSIAGPGRPQDRIPLRMAKKAFEEALPSLLPPEPPPTQKLAAAEVPTKARLASGAKSSRTTWRMCCHPATDIGKELRHGSVVIAAITSCTNTSNPSVMIAAGLLAKKAVERGPAAQALGQDIVGARLAGRDGILRQGGSHALLGALGFNLVGYGCTTCIGNSGPLLPEVSEAI